MGESGDQLQRTGSATPSPAQRKTSRPTSEQSVPLYQQEHVLSASAFMLLSTDMLKMLSVQPHDAFMTMIVLKNGMKTVWAV